MDAVEDCANARIFDDPIFMLDSWDGANGTPSAGTSDGCKLSSWDFVRMKPSIRSYAMK